MSGWFQWWPPRKATPRWSATVTTSCAWMSFKRKLTSPARPTCGPLKVFRSMLRFLAAIPKIAVTALIVLAIVNLLIGVILRYFVGAITDYFDMDPVPFTWVEEVGEMSLAWLTLIGAAITDGALDWIELGRLMREELGWHDYPAYPTAPNDTE